MRARRPLRVLPALARRARSTSASLPRPRQSARAGRMAAGVDAGRVGGRVRPLRVDADVGATRRELPSPALGTPGGHAAIPHRCRRRTDRRHQDRLAGGRAARRRPARCGARDRRRTPRDRRPGVVPTSPRPIRGIRRRRARRSPGSTSGTRAGNRSRPGSRSTRVAPRRSDHRDPTRTSPRRSSTRPAARRPGAGSPPQPRSSSDRSRSRSILPSARGGSCAAAAAAPRGWLVREHNEPAVVGGSDTARRHGLCAQLMRYAASMRPPAATCGDAPSCSCARGEAARAARRGVSHGRPISQAMLAASVAGNFSLGVNIRDVARAASSCPASAEPTTAATGSSPGSPSPRSTGRRPQHPRCGGPSRRPSPIRTRQKCFPGSATALSRPPCCGTATPCTGSRALQVTATRELGVLTMLPLALNTLAHVSTIEGDLDGAGSAMAEANQILEVTGGNAAFVGRSDLGRLARRWRCVGGDR